MTVSASAAKAGPYTGNGVASSFAFSFKVFADADIRVVETVIATGAETDLVLNTNYTLVRNVDQDNNPGGAVTYRVGGVTTALPSTKKLTIIGAFDYEQPTDIPNGGAFFASVVENALDRNALLVKQLKEKLDRTLALPTSDAVDGELPAISARADMLLGFNTAGEPVTVAPASGSAADLATDLASTALGKGPAMIGFSHDPTATPGTVGAKLQQGISITDEPFGAVAGTDCTAAIDAAEAVAYAAGAELVFPPGTYWYNGSKAYRCSISAYGATIKNIVGSEQGSVFGSAVVKFDTVSELYVHGLTVDANNYSTGFGAEACSNITYRDAHVINAMNSGFCAYNCARPLYDGCTVNGVDYVTAGTSADGFYAAGCTDATYYACKADDFERIGFVSEGNGGARSYRTKWHGCIANNGHDCDSGTGQWNAGFWSENTNGVVIDACTVTDIAGNSGQTSGLVAGVILNAVGDDTEAVSVLTNSSIGDSSGDMPYGVNISGTANLANVVVENTVISNYKTGVSCLGGINSLSVRGVMLRNGEYAAASNGGVVIDCTGGGALGSVTIDSISESNATYTSAAAATVKVYRAPSDGELRIVSSSGIKINNQSATGYKKIVIDTCDVVVSDATFSMAEATEFLSLSNSTFARSGSGPVVLFGGSSTSGNNCRTHVSNCKFLDFDSISIVRGNSFILNGNTFENSTAYWVPATAGQVLKLDCNYWRNHSTQTTALSINGAAGSTIFHANGNTFSATNVANTPLIFATTQPAYVYLQGNGYFTTALSTLVGSTKNEQTYNFKLV